MSGGMLRFYTDDAPGLKITPLVVLYAQAQETSVDDMLHESGFELQMVVRLSLMKSTSSLRSSRSLLILSASVSVSSS